MSYKQDKEVSKAASVALHILSKGELNKSVADDVISSRVDIFEKKILPRYCSKDVDTNDLVEKSITLFEYVLKHPSLDESKKYVSELIENGITTREFKNIAEVVVPGFQCMAERRRRCYELMESKKKYKEGKSSSSDISSISFLGFEMDEIIRPVISAIGYELVNIKENGCISNLSPNDIELKDMCIY